MISLKPLIIFPWNEVNPPLSAFKIVSMIEESGGEVSKLNYKDPEVDCLGLKEEVESIAKNIETNFIAFEILKTAKRNKNLYPEIFKILIKVKSAMKGVQGLLLPGGQDIQPIFYGQSLHEKTEQTDDLRRDVFECALLKIAYKRDLSIFGICRGQQIFNVCLGGTLNQHVEGHNKCIQTYSVLENTSNQSVISQVIMQAYNALIGDSRHHQTVQKIGKDLNVIVRHEDGTIKALESFKNRFIVLVQWHPETCKDENMKSLTSPENFDFFKHFVNASKNYGSATRVI